MAWFAGRIVDAKVWLFERVARLAYRDLAEADLDVLVELAEERPRSASTSTD